VVEGELSMAKEVPYISVQACPVCGEHPELKKESLERPGGHGYRGCYTYQYHCEYCKLLKGGETCDISISAAEAKNLAKQRWNEEVDRVKKLQQAYHASQDIIYE
jgi:hypothetical protein